jgi:hypothetical protein
MRSVAESLRGRSPPNGTRTEGSPSDSESNESNLGWSEDIEGLARDIEYNCARLSEIHKRNYIALHEQQKYFKIPIIVLSSCNSIFAVGLVSYMDQNVVSSVNCLLSLISAIICSIELYIGLQKRIETELMSYRSFYLLSVRISNCLKLEREHREELSGSTFLSSIENEYKTLFSDSLIHNESINDALISVEIKKVNPILREPDAESPRAVI